MTTELSREDAYIEVMLLMAFADGVLGEEEIAQLAFTVANREEFQDLSEEQLADAVSRALERLHLADSQSRLAELAECLPDEAERFKATVFAYSILVADGVVAPGETRCLLEIQEAFGLSVPELQATRPVRQKRAEATRARLLEAGRRLLSTEGYYATSSKKIAREAGVAVGSFYNYFEDKKALFLELFKDGATRRRQRVLQDKAALQIESDPGRFCRGVVDLVLRSVEDTDEIQREMAVLRHSDRAVQALVEGETRRLAELVVTALEASATPPLRVESPHDAALLIVTLLEETLLRFRVDGPVPPDDPRLVALAEVAARYLFITDPR